MTMVIITVLAMGCAIVAAATYVGIKADLNFDREQFLGDIRHRPLVRSETGARAVLGRMGAAARQALRF